MAQSGEAGEGQSALPDRLDGSEDAACRRRIARESLSDLASQLGPERLFKGVDNAVSDAGGILVREGSLR
jgi:hypothetical protein